MVSFAIIPVKWKTNFYKCFLALYGGQRLATLDEYRYYNRNIAIKSMGATFTLAAFPPTSVGGRRSPAVACWASDHWVASSNPLRGKFRH